VRLEGQASALLDQQALEHGLDRVGAAEDALEPRPAAAVGSDDRQIAGTRLVAALLVQQDRRPGREVRLADDELPSAPRDLDDGGR
jgi:hypothetical protein